MNRNTTLLVYRKLQSEGWIAGRPGGGTFVAAHPPGLRSPEPAALVPAAPLPGQRLLRALTGHADPSLLPALALARAYRRSLSDPAPLLEEPPAAGSRRLRGELATLLSQSEGLPTRPEELLITGGLQESFHLVAQALLAPGDRVAVEALGHRRHWEALEAAGAELVPIPVDAEGLRVDALDAAGAAPFRAVLLTPRCQYPTTRALSRPRRAALLAFAARTGATLLECDADAGLHHEAGVPLPLAAEDPAGLVLYLGSFAKVLFPTLPLAFLRAPAPLAERLAAAQSTLSRGADPVFSQALSELLRDGELQRHLHRLRRTATERRDLLAAALENALGGCLRIQRPAMGLALWAEVDPLVDVEAWATRGLQRGVAFTRGRDYEFHRRPVQALRLGFASHDGAALEEIVRRMALALKG